ncbi:PSTK [Lepeophtheirus salmonis]|nr:PSTK [Lepeophtheirus salmonis]CAF3021427.1 PSTK [Lepeophtheirus salmonis]
MIDSSFLEESVVNYFEMIESVLNTALNNPVPDVITINKAKADESRLVCNASVIHQADNIFRKKINSLIKNIKANCNLSKEEAQIKIQDLLVAKSELLEDLKTGFTKIPSDIVQHIGSKERRDSILPKLSDELELLLEDKLRR